MKIHLLFAATLAPLAALGCNPNGTCMSEKEVGELGAQCTINTNKKACSLTEASQFFPEDGPTGIVRCKSMGYGDAPGSSQKDPKALRIFYRRSAPPAK